MRFFALALRHEQFSQQFVAHRLLLQLRDERN